MKFVILFTALSLLVTAADRKPLPGQAGNDDIELVAIGRSSIART